ncbi:MAG TPA: CHRD domain-containing protein [Chitinophagaceae bacterium]|nr:CHRD domain-containing protein [Chitinophagaceae bacterium]
MKIISMLLTATISLFGLLSCEKYDDVPFPSTLNPNIVFKATLTGTQEVPANASTATGEATLVYDSIGKVFTLSVTHTIPNPTNGHIHKAPVGVSGGVIFPFASFTSPISLTSPVLDATQEADLKAHLYYVNIHTAAFPGGEIRGQLIRQ